jgi:hypothetical protein
MVPNINELTKDCGAVNNLDDMSQEDKIKFIIERVKY